MSGITWENWVNVVKIVHRGLPGAVGTSGRERRGGWNPIASSHRRLAARTGFLRGTVQTSPPNSSPSATHFLWNSTVPCVDQVLPGVDRSEPVRRRQKPLFHQLASWPWEIEEWRRSGHSSKDDGSVKEAKNGRQNRWFPGLGCSQL